MNQPKRRLTVLSALAVLLSAAMFFAFLRDKSSRPKDTDVGREISHDLSDSNSLPTKEAGRFRGKPSTPSVGKRVLETAERAKALIDSQDLWRTPIEFFGKVVDENGNPVPVAQAHLTWTDLSKQGHSEKRLQSDADGRFALKDVQGYALSVQVEKGGYRTSASNRSSFFYAGQNVNFSPDPAKPVVFRLQKMIPGEPLNVVHFPGFGRLFQLKGSGETSEFDLVRGESVPVGKGHIQVSLTRRPAVGKQFDWSWSVTVRNGGLLESTAEFDVVAPESGYKHRHELRFPHTADDWQRELMQKYFLRFDDGTYGRISFRLLAHNGVLRFESFLNPSGSRNLEYDPVQPKAAR
jgi:hypothetical protein